MINRRDMLAATATGVVAATAGAKAAARYSGAPDVAVVGAGAFGGFTALSLQERGMRVTSIDQYGPGNTRAASGDESRAIRASYGDEEFYSRWVLKALPLWRQRQEEFGRQVLYPSPILTMDKGMTPHVASQQRIFDKLKIDYEILDQAALRKRFTQMNFDDVGLGFIENGAGFLRARDSLIMTRELLERKGGKGRIARAIPGEKRGRTLLNLNLGNGETLSAGQYVFACGPWSSRTLSVMAPKVEVVRGEVYYFGTPPGDDRFSWPKLPVFLDLVAGGYGFGSLDRGLKFGPTEAMPKGFDPDYSERRPTQSVVEHAHAYLAKRFPDMRNAPFLEGRVCNTENPANSNFIIDRHPDYDNVWIASGGGGHSFKFGPLLGQYVAGRVMGQVDPEADALFTLASHPDQIV